MPAGQLRGLVGMKPGMDAHAHARQELGKSEIAGRGICRIAIQDQECIDAARRHVAGEIGERAGPRRPVGDGFAIPDGPSAVAEPVVDLRRQCLHGGRQVRAGRKQRVPRMRAQIRGCALDPTGFRRAQADVRAGRDAELGRERACQIADAGGVADEPGRRHRTGRARNAFGDMHDDTRRLRGFAPVLRPSARMAHLMGRGAEQIVLQAHHHGAILQAVVQVELAAEGEPQAGGAQPRSYRLLDVQARCGKFRAQRLELANEGGRGDVAGEDAQSFAAPLAPLGSQPDQRVLKCLPGGGLAIPQRCLGAVRIVELEHRRLGEGVAGPQARRMLGIAVELGGPAFVGGGEHGLDIACERHRAGIIARDAGQHVFRLVDVRQRQVGRLLRAAGKAGEQQ